VQIDDIVEGRLNQERKKFSDYDSYKAAAAKLKEIEDGAKTELERATTRITELETSAVEKELKNQNTMLDVRVEAEVTARKLVDKEAAMLLLDRTLITTGEDGTPNIAAAMDALLTAKPWLVSSGEGTPAPPQRQSADLGARTTIPNPNTDQLSRADMQRMTSEARVQAMKNGQFRDALAGKSPA
jgi:hypothetical protein